MHIISNKRLQKMLKEAYEQGLNIRDQIDCQTKKIRGTIIAGYDVEKAVEEILKQERFWAVFLRR